MHDMSDAWKKAEQTITDCRILNVTGYIVLGLLFVSFGILVSHLLYGVVIKRNTTVSKIKIATNWRKMIVRTMMFSLSTWTFIINIIYCIVLWITFDDASKHMKDGIKIYQFSFWFCVISSMVTLGMLAFN